MNHPYKSVKGRGRGVTPAPPPLLLTDSCNGPMNDKSLI